MAKLDDTFVSALGKELKKWGLEYYRIYQDNEDWIEIRDVRLPGYMADDFYVDINENGDKLSVWHGDPDSPSGEAETSVNPAKIANIIYKLAKKLPLDNE